jgi:hypothetical protein
MAIALTHENNASSTAGHPAESRMQAALRAAGFARQKLR